MTLSDTDAQTVAFGRYTTPWPCPHNRETCRWCWEESCMDLSDYIVMPPWDLRARMPTVAEYANLSNVLPERVFSGHRP